MKQEANDSECDRSNPFASITRAQRITANSPSFKTQMFLLFYSSNRAPETGICETVAILILSVANRKPGNLPRACTPEAADASVVLGEFDKVQCSANAATSMSLESNRGDHGPNK